MPFSLPFPFDPARIVFEDDFLIVVDKPAFVSTIASDPSRKDDLVSRLKKFLALRDGKDEASVYLGVHQRLDKETSGLILFAKSKEANASLSQQFESRSIEKIYEAWVSNGTRTKPPEGALRHRLLERKRGLVLTTKNANEGKEARARMRVIESKELAHRVEVKLETGLTHQIRVQLQTIGYPIVGDTLYGTNGAEKSSRLLLRAKKLSLLHPITKTPLAFACLPDGAFDRNDARAERSTEEWKELLLAAAEKRYELFSQEEPWPTTAFRLLHESGDGCPGVAIDLYGEFAVVHLYEPREDFRKLCAALLELGVRGVYCKERPQKAQDISFEDKERMAPAYAVAGEDAPEEFLVRENGESIYVRLGDGLSTGIFLDQRENRKKFGQLSEGKRVLNLFAYTCAFSAFARFGNATSTTSVDASKVLLERGKMNVTAAGFSELDRFVYEDVFVWLKRAAKREKYDLIVVDPPTFSTTRDSRFTSGKDWILLMRAIAPLCADDCTILCTSNDRRLDAKSFALFIRQGLVDTSPYDKLAGELRIESLVQSDPPVDFPPLLERGAHLKTVWVKVKRDARSLRTDEFPRSR